jgi:hypothetical protein
LIKIEITNDVENAKKEHWKWIQNRFPIASNGMGLKGDAKRIFTIARKKKKELYILLGYVSKKQCGNDALVDSKDSLFEKLICADPKELLSLCHDKQYSTLVLKTPNNIQSLNKKKRILKALDKSNPNYSFLKKKIDLLEKKYKKDIRNFNKRVKMGEKVRKILNYELLYKKDNSWNAYELCRKINLSVCPYCNRQYIFTVKRKNEWTVRPQLDHFFIKTVYPFLSCSFFNLIPSCPFCNEGKGDDDRETIYPYLEEFGKNYVFRMDINDLNLLKTANTVKENDNYSICLDDKNVYTNVGQNYEQVDTYKKFQQLLHLSNKIFHLTELYNAHQSDLKDLLEKYVSVTGANLDELADKYYNGKKNITDKEKESLRKILLGLPIKIENGDYPLRKFKEDIIDQLDKEK